MNNKKRYIIMIILSVLLNQAMYTIADGFNLPVWMDMTGTALASLTLETAAGLVVGLINNFYLAIVMRDSGGILYYAVSAVTAVVVGAYLKKGMRVKPSRLPGTLVLITFLATFISSFISYFHAGGVPTGNWETQFYNMAISGGAGKFLSLMFGVGVVKVLDVLASAAIVAVIYMVLPKKLKHDPNVDMFESVK